MSVLPRFAFTPFSEDGEWTVDEGWQRAIDRVPGWTGAPEALGALREVFPPEWIRTKGWARPPDMPIEKWPVAFHPIAYHYAFRGGRELLLELGRALVELKVASASTRWRLKTTTEYLATMAELRAGLMLHLAGFAVRHEPLPNSTKGPDWEARSPDGQTIAVEVKCLEPGDVSRTRHECAASVVSEFSRLLHTNPPIDDAAAWAELVLSEEAIDTLEALPSRARREERACEMAAIAASELHALARHGHFEEHFIEQVGRISLRSPNFGSARIVVSAGGPLRRNERAVLRIRDKLLDAAAQLSRMPGLPGVVVLDSLKGMDAAAFERDIQAMLADEELRDRVAAIVILDRTLLMTSEQPRIRILHGHQANHRRLSSLSALELPLAEKIASGRRSIFRRDGACSNVTGTRRGPPG